MILGDAQSGRLYKALVDNKKAVSDMGRREDMHDPGFAWPSRSCKPDQSIDDARQVHVKTWKSLAAEPPTQEEVDRAKARIQKQFELTLARIRRPSA